MARASSPVIAPELRDNLNRISASISELRDELRARDDHFDTRFTELERKMDRIESSIETHSGQICVLDGVVFGTVQGLTNGRAEDLVSALDSVVRGIEEDDALSAVAKTGAIGMVSNWASIAKSANEA